jgi:hypothetical protein
LQENKVNEIVGISVLEGFNAIMTAAHFSLKMVLDLV